jgi:hypothetical protein
MGKECMFFMSCFSWCDKFESGNIIPITVSCFKYISIIVRKSEKMTTQHNPVMFCGFWVLCILILVVPAGATPYPITFRGTISELNQTDHTMTIVSDCDRTVCDMAMLGAYTGTITNDEVFASLIPTDYVEVMYKSWMGQYPCEEPEYKIKCTTLSHEPIPLGNWAGIARLGKEPGNDTWFITDIWGDPSNFQAPLMYKYSFDYELGPEKTGCPLEQPVWECNAGYANITLLHANKTVAERKLQLNETFYYQNRDDNTTISILFIKGTATSHQVISPGGCPCADMVVHIQPTPPRSPLVQTSPSFMQSTPVSLFTIATALGFTVVLVLSVRWKKTN